MDNAPYCTMAAVSGGADSAAVRAFFETDKYLKGNPLIPVRAGFVASLLQGVRGGRILDLGCGDGAVSRPLLAADNELTLVDFSTAMLERARHDTPAGARVTFILSDVLSYVTDTPYDAVLCVGVLAHLPSIEPMIARISQSLKPGGLCVLQITDVESPLGWALNQYQRLRVKVSAYAPLHPMSRSKVVAIASRHKLALRATRKYALSIPGSGRLPEAMQLSLEASFARSALLSRAGAEALMSFERLA